MAKQNKPPEYPSETGRFFSLRRGGGGVGSGLHFYL